MEFKFQRCSRKLSCLFPPCCQSTPERLLAGVFMDQDKHKVNKKAKKKKRANTISSHLAWYVKDLLSREQFFLARPKWEFLSRQEKHASPAWAGSQSEHKIHFTLPTCRTNHRIITLIISSLII